MTSHEIVSRCIEFRGPPRIGLHFQTDPIQGRVWDETDFACVGYAADPQPESIGTTVERAQRQYEAFKRHGNYPLVRP